MKDVSMANMTTPLTMNELTGFLEKLDKKKCPWCDGNHWGLHIGANQEPPVPGLRSLPHALIYAGDDGSLKGTINVGTETALIVAAVECGDCGYLYLFNYFTIMKKVRESHDGKDS